MRKFQEFSRKIVVNYPSKTYENFDIIPRNLDEIMKKMLQNLEEMMKKLRKL